MPAETVSELRLFRTGANCGVLPKSSSNCEDCNLEVTGVGVSLSPVSSKTFPASSETGSLLTWRPRPPSSRALSRGRRLKPNQNFVPVLRIDKSKSRRTVPIIVAAGITFGRWLTKGLRPTAVMAKACYVLSPRFLQTCRSDSARTSTLSSPVRLPSKASSPTDAYTFANAPCISAYVAS